MPSSISSEQLGLTGNDSIKFTGSQINYFFICKRKLWLFSHYVELEPESDLVKLGKLLHENRYKRKLKEVQIDRIKIDFMENKKIEGIERNAKQVDFASPTQSQNIGGELAEKIPTHADTGDSKKEVVIHEVKRSKKMQEAHIFQLLYYMYYLRKNYGVNSTHGVLHYPLLNQNVDVSLTEDRIKQIEEAIVGISHVNSLAKPPEPVWKGYCRSCAYRDLCWG